jgi:DNA topoisomerase 2-associated protein PAT1
MSAPSKSRKFLRHVRYPPDRRSQTSQKRLDHSSQHSLETIWDEKSPFFVLSRVNGSADRSSEHRQISNTSNFSPFQNDDPPSINYQHPSRPIQFSPFQTDDSPPTTYQQLVAHENTLTGLWPLQETETDIRVVPQNQAFTLAEQQLHQQELLRLQQLQQQQQRLQQQQLLLQQEQLRQEQLRQEQLRQEQLRRLQLQQQHRNQRTPPPRMLPTPQSPRFLERQQRQIMLLQQQQQEIQQQQRLRELQEQLQMEELQRQLRAQQLSQARQRSPNPFGDHQRQTSGPTLAELQAAQLLHQQRPQSSAAHDSRLQTSLPQTASYHPQNVQLQQRLLAEIAQGEHARELQVTSPLDQEALRSEAMKKILETERMEEKRRRKAAKIAHMVGSLYRFDNRSLNV